MIKHNELAARLNSRLYKDTTANIEEDKILAAIEEISLKEELPQIESVIESQPSTQSRVITNIINYIEFAFNVVCFGYATEFLFNASWPILGTLAVGYTINFLFNKILFHFSS
jgi:hypothetical protein